MAKIIFLVALDRNNLMGGSNTIPWHHPEDIKRFKKITTGYPVVMGRKTWESLSIQPLPNRINIVLTRDQNYTTFGKAEVYNNLKDVLTTFKNYDKIFVIGGAEIFNSYINYADILDVTKIDAEYEGDVYWHGIDTEVWELESSTVIDILDFRIYTRRKVL